MIIHGIVSFVQAPHLLCCLFSHFLLLLLFIYYLLSSQLLRFHDESFIRVIFGWKFSLVQRVCLARFFNDEQIAYYMGVLIRS